MLLEEWSVGEFTSSELNTDFLVTAKKDLSDKFNIVAKHWW